MDDAGSSLSDLKNVLKETLEARGCLAQIKARIRSEVFAALDDNACCHESQSTTRPTLSNENLVINELIREYLVYNGYRHTHSVFVAESGQPQEAPFQRDFLAKELKVDEDRRFTHVPLLYGIIASRQSLQLHREEQRDARSVARDRDSHSRSAGSMLNFNSQTPSDETEPSPIYFGK